MVSPGADEPRSHPAAARKGRKGRKTLQVLSIECPRIRIPLRTAIHILMSQTQNRHLMRLSRLAEQAGVGRLKSHLACALAAGPVHGWKKPDVIEFHFQGLLCLLVLLVEWESLIDSQGVKEPQCVRRRLHVTNVTHDDMETVLVQSDLVAVSVNVAREMCRLVFPGLLHGREFRVTAARDLVGMLHQKRHRGLPNADTEHTEIALSKSQNKATPSFQRFQTCVILDHPSRDDKQTYAGLGVKVFPHPKETAGRTLFERDSNLVSDGSHSSSAPHDREEASRPNWCVLIAAHQHPRIIESQTLVSLGNSTPSSSMTAVGSVSQAESPGPAPKSLENDQEKPERSTQRLERSTRSYLRNDPMRPVVVKMVLEDSVDEKTLVNEIRSYKRLGRDARILGFHESGTVDGYMRLELQYSDQGSIKDRLQSGAPFDEVRILQYAREVASALTFVHSRKFIWNGCSAEHVLLDFSNSVKICGFGLCREGLNYVFSEDEELRYIQRYARWLAPEIVKDFKCRRRSDIWSLGCLVVEMATREDPHADCLNTIEVIRKLNRESNPRPEIVNKDDFSLDFSGFLNRIFISPQDQRPYAADLLEQRPFVGAG
ncbi:hypothetical protein Q7P37_009746 [Cladosporium fusiforme]